MLSVLLVPFSKLRRWLFGQPAAERNKPPITVVAIEPIGSAPAVAGFLLCLESRAESRVDFYLSARLASVAQLNTKAGRAPYKCLQRIAPVKPIPSAQAANGKRCKAAVSKPRIVSRELEKSISATVIEMPAAASRRIPLDVRIAQAA
jgi:hypothetical protein